MFIDSVGNVEVTSSPVLKPLVNVESIILIFLDSETETALPRILLKSERSMEILLEDFICKTVGQRVAGGQAPVPWSSKPIS